MLNFSDGDAYRKTLEYLEQAAKRPTVLYYQIDGIIAEGTNYAKALKRLNEAIAIDVGDPLSYVYIAETLTFNGKAREALPYMRTAMRLDPHYPSFYAEILGKIQFGLERYDEAAIALEEAANLNPEDERIYPMLAATYAYLGRKDDAKAAASRFSEIRISRGGMPQSVNSVDYAFADNEYKTRLVKGLLLAGMPLRATDENYAAKYQLHADEIRALFLGHSVHGRDLAKATQHSATVSVEGVASMSGDWGEVSGGTFHMEGELLCLLPAGGTRYCGNVFRIPGGTKAQAQLKLGWWLMNGKGVVEVDEKQGMEWLVKSAEQGNPHALFEAGMGFWKGKGVPQDLMQAYVWLSLAPTKEGFEAAAEHVSEIEKSLTAAQLVEAQRLSKEWKSK